MQKYIDKLKKIDKKWIISGITLLVIIFGFFIWNSHRKYDVSDQIKVSFTGYNGRGTVDLDDSSAHKRIFEIIGKREGLKQADIDRIEANHFSFDDMIDIYSKALKTENLTDMVSIKLSKYDNLSNGDKVKLMVKVPSKEIPIKEATKTFTVKGLKKVKTIGVKDIKSKLKISFKGISGLGQIKITSKKYRDMTFKVKKNGKLGNGDKVKITINKQGINDIQSDGVIFKGSRTFEVTASGLQDINKISNIQDVINLNTSMAKDYNRDNEATTHKVELIHSYIKNYSNEYSYENNVSSQVSANEQSSFKDTYNVVGLYKITTTGSDSSSEVSYAQFGYKNLSIEDGSLNINDKNVDDDSIQNSNLYSSLDIAQQKVANKAVLIK